MIVNVSFSHAVDELQQYSSMNEQHFSFVVRVHDKTASAMSTLVLGMPKVILSVLGADPEKDGTDGFFVAVFQRSQVPV